MFLVLHVCVCNGEPSCESNLFLSSGFYLLVQTNEETQIPGKVTPLECP